MTATTTTNLAKGSAGQTADSPNKEGTDAASSARLEALETCAWEAWRDAIALSRQGCERLLAAAAVLAEAGALSSAEEWTAWLDRAGIPRAGVHRLLELHRVGATYEMLDQLGGVLLAAAWAGEARLPGKGEVLAITAGEWQPDRAVPVAYVYRAPETPDAFHAALVDLAAPATADHFTRGALAHERDVWGTVWHLLGQRFGDVALRPIRADAARLVARLEARRRDALTTDVRVVH